MNLRKIFSIALIIVVATALGGAISYVRAEYIEPAGAPVGNNAPAPVLVGDVGTNEWPSGKAKSFTKQGKIGITNNKDSNPVDNDQFSSNTLVVMGQLSTESFTSFTINRIMAQLESSSNLYPLFVGNPTNSSFMQTNNDSSPLTVKVTDHTRAPRLVIGSKTAPGNIYNLYLAEVSNATNLGKALDIQTYTNGPNGDYEVNNKTSFCTLTENQLKNNGCPAMTYIGQIIPDFNPNTAGDIVASCHQTTPQSASYPYNNFNKGSCY